MHSPLLRPFIDRCTRRFGQLTLVALLFALPAASRAFAEDAPSRVHFLFNLEFSDKYLTPRGMIVQDKGLTTQVLFLAFANLYHGDSFINDVTLMPGIWNDYATSGIPAHLGEGSRKTHWVEYDPILGLSFGFAKNFKLDVTYTEFAMQILDIGTSRHLETKLSYDDSKVLGKYALHPYISYWRELSGKATAAANFGVPKSSYIDIGIAPSFASGSMKFEAPIRALLPSANFYGETFGKKSSVALWELGVKASGPASFMPEGYGHWNWHVGVRYMDFVDKNLQQLSTAGGFGGRTSSTTQLYTGISSFF